MNKIKRAQVVCAQDVIRVCVGKDNPFNGPDTVLNRLLTEVGAGVDQDSGVVGQGDAGRGAVALVVRVG